jgi:hypothetical protein
MTSTWKRRPKSPPTKKPPKAPPQFTIGIGETSEEAYNRIYDRLQAMRIRLGVGDVRIHKNRDGSIDGELSYETVRGQPTYGSGSASFRLESAFDTQHAVGHRFWLAIVFRFIAPDKDDIYRKWQGMLEVWTHYRRCTRTKMIAAFEAADLIARNIERKHRRKVSYVLVRLHWNPENARPQR